MGMLGWFVVKLVVAIVISLVLGMLVGDRGPTTDMHPGKFEAPVVTSSDPIPVLFGRMMVKAPNVVWYGDVSSYPWEKCV